jgi:hypothetical protein
LAEARVSGWDCVVHYMCTEGTQFLFPVEPATRAIQGYLAHKKPHPPRALQ